MSEHVSAIERGTRGAAQVFNSLRDDIIALRLEPGLVLSRAELQARFGLSSTPVRDALIRLQNEGLVEIYPQHATKVAPIDLALAREAQFLRRSVELELVRSLALKQDMALNSQLKRLIQQQVAFADLNEFEAFAAADQAFHRTMYEALGIGALWHLVRQRGGHIDRLRRLHLPVDGKMHEIIAAHNRIADAIVAGNADSAQSAMREHLSHSLDFVDTLRVCYPQYFR
ncbi:MAG: GntR family transcriptional regulator [Proteobacteria bacterium]|nr:GntR family transcriptional regulator [Pseudomonadota bacterium]